MNTALLGMVLAVLISALLVTILFRKFELPVILGYLVVGALIGPHALTIVPDPKYVSDFAEIGIVLLMFTIGLEFSLPKLFALRYVVLAIGLPQVILTIAFTTIIGILLGMTVLTAITVGGIVAMSSTAIVLKQLSDQLELYTPHGMNAMGILLLQDLAVIPFIILIPSLGHGEHLGLTFTLSWALIKGVVAILIIFVVGRWLLRPLFHMIAKTKAIELFSLAVLLVALTAAWLTHMFGLSYALGAFLAGMMLSETEFKHQIEVEIRPFKDILLGLFFISIGMLTNVTSWGYTAPWIILLTLAIVVGKSILVTVISWLAKVDLSTSLRTGLILAQGGEFGFAILTIALTYGVLPPDYGQVVIAALLISIAISPMLILYNRKIAFYLLPKITKQSENIITKKIQLISNKMKNHVIICGYGRVGQHIARLLEKVKIDYIGIDLDPGLVERATLAGEKIIYGDPARGEILKAAGIDNAKVLVISFSDVPTTSMILSNLKHTNPNLPTLVRCRDENELKELKEYRPTQIVAEIFEESLTLSNQLLRILNFPASKIAELIHDIRHKEYDLLYKVFTGNVYSGNQDEDPLQEQLMPILITSGSDAVHKKIKDLNLDKLGVEIIALRRGHEKYQSPSKNTKLLANDIIIIYGSADNIDKAERRILDGARF